MTTSLILSAKMNTPGCVTINDTINDTNNAPPMMTLTWGTQTIPLHIIQAMNPNMLINMPDNSLATLRITDQSGQAILTITEKPFVSTVQQLLSMVEREDRKLGASL